MFDSERQPNFFSKKIGNLEVVYSPELEISGYYYAQDDRVEITGTHVVGYLKLQSVF